MKIKTIGGIIGILSVLSPLIAESITGISAPFAFPAQASIKSGGIFAQLSYFRYQHRVGTNANVTIAWSIPEKHAHNGAIAIYTLSGKVVRSFPIAATNGMLTWRVTDDKVATGIYYARLTSGAYSNTLKMVLFN
jgi:hypothetical protein